MEHADGISPAWPIDYETLAPYYDAAERLYSVHGQAGIDPTEPPRAPYPHAPIPHAPRMAELVEQLRARGLHPAPLPLGLRDPGVQGGCVLCDTCNSFPCRVLAKSEADVCCVRPALTHPNVTLVTRTMARRMLHRSVGQARRERGTGARRRGAPRVRAPGRGVGRRRAVGRAAAAVGVGPASPRPGQLVGHGRPPLHGPSGDDAAGLRSAPRERHGVPEDRRDQRLLLRRTGTALPARPHPVAGPHARRDGADRRAVGARLGLRRLGGPRRGLAGDVGRPPPVRQPGDRGIRRPRPRELPSQ